MCVRKVYIINRTDHARAERTQYPELLQESCKYKPRTSKVVARGTAIPYPFEHPFEMEEFPAPGKGNPEGNLINVTLTSCDLWTNLSKSEAPALGRGFVSQSWEEV